jgi:ribose-phosphate pyrophosphokinase
MYVGKNGSEMLIFAGKGNPELAREVARELVVEFDPVEILEFPDGEIKPRYETNIRGRKVIIFQPTCPPVAKNSWELLLMIDAAKRASAEEVTAFIPYYGWGRQDKKDEPRVPISASLMARFIELLQAKRIVTVDLHSAQTQGNTLLPFDNLAAYGIMADAMVRDGVIPESRSERSKYTVVAPDSGGVGRAQDFQVHLDIRRFGVINIMDP